MKYLSLSKVGMVLISAVSLSGITACSSNADPYRTYMENRHCEVFYVDSEGQRVVNGKNVHEDFAGMVFDKQDSHGRWYHQDSFGNRIYRDYGC